MSTSFEPGHAQPIVGTLTTVDRLIVHGHLQSFWFRGLGLARCLDRQGLHISRDFGSYVRQARDRVIAHAKSLAATARRPYIFQRRVERGMDDLARPIAKRDGITQGLICVLEHRILQAVLAGEHAIHGFRNRDLQVGLYSSPAQSPLELKSRCARVSRIIAKLRAHGLVAKVPGSRLYRVTERGHRLMGLAIRFRLLDFPHALAA